MSKTATQIFNLNKRKILTNNSKLDELGKFKSNKSQKSFYNVSYELKNSKNMNNSNAFSMSGNSHCNSFYKNFNYNPSKIDLHFAEKYLNKTNKELIGNEINQINNINNFEDNLIKNEIEEINSNSITNADVNNILEKKENSISKNNSINLNDCNNKMGSEFVVNNEDVLVNKMNLTNYYSYTNIFNDKIKKKIFEKDVEKKVELLKNKMNSEILKILKEEKSKEEERQILYIKANGEVEKRKLECLIALERAQSSEKILRLNE